MIAVLFFVHFSGSHAGHLQGTFPKSLTQLMQQKLDSYTASEGPRVRATQEDNGHQRIIRQQRTSGGNRAARTLVSHWQPHKGTTTTTKDKVVTTTVTQTRFVGDVMFRVVDDSDSPRPVPGLPVSIQASDSEATPIRLAGRFSRALFKPTEPTVLKTAPDGSVQLTELKMPSLLTVRVSPETSDWSIDSEHGEGRQIAVVEDDDRAGDRLDVSQPKMVFLKRVGHTTYKKVVITETRKVHYIVPEPVVVRHEVADFVMPKMIGIASLRSETPTFYLGDQQIQPKDDGPSWRFSVKRDMVPSEDAKLAISFKTQHGDYFGETDIAQPNFHQDNMLPAPSLTLESIPNDSITVGDKPVDEAFPVSPIQMLAAGGANEITGQDALNALGISGMPKLVDSPKEAAKKGLNEYRFLPGGKDGRYGQWIVLDDRGITLRCRWDPDDAKAGKSQSGHKYLPDKSTGGLLEALRITTPEGGSVGGTLKVGASQQDVINTFGDPDKLDYDPNDLLNMKSSDDRALDIFGDKDLEAWDDTYLYGGIRIKWEAGHVKWYEVTRPVQLLYNGTKAFNPPESKSIYVGQIAGDGHYDDIVRRSLESFVQKSSGVRLADSADDANLLLTGRYALDVEKTEVYHQHQTKVADTDRHGNVIRDKNGNIKYHKEFVNETFTCPSVTATVRISLSLRDRSTGDTQEIQLPESEGVNSGPHTEGQRCPVPSEQPAIDEALSGKGQGPKNSWQRAFGNAVADSVDTAGTVIAVNYKKGRLLVNLGERNGIHEKGDEGTEMALYLLSDVDVKTGKPKTTIDDDRLVGGTRDHFLEVQRVGPNWCIVEPKKKGDFGHTVTDYDVIQRIVDPGSGLVRVRVVSKAGK